MFSLLRSLFGRLSRRAPARRLTLEVLEDRAVPALLGNSLFPVDNPWNQKISNAPVASNSAAIITNITTLYGDGRLHPDFGQDSHNSSDLYGIPYNVVHGNSQAKVHVIIDAYPGESDLQDAPIPANSVLEGDFQNGPKAGVNARGDSHLLVYDVDNNVAYEFYRASRPTENSDGRWHADQETVWDMKTNQFRTLGWTSADAAGLAILPGLVRPDEALPVNQGGQGAINHAIRFTLQNKIILDQFLYPASHVANAGNTNAAVEPPMGARFRLKAGVDLSQLNPQSRIIAQAMKDYGMIVADNGSNFFFSGASYSVDASNNFALTFNDNDVQDSTHGLKSLHYSDFEVVDLTPVVTGLSASRGSAGATVTVIGKNFSGAAGHLQVLFGGVPATNVTVIDDAHVSAVAPAGSGTVDVRVQSGVNAPGNSSNIKNPIFGYGTSATTAADRFTYGNGTGGNAAPTVATPASATPAPVTGTTTVLDVLGADDAGEANLTYTWAMLNGPTGARPVFSINGSNAAKHLTVTFDRTGSYAFGVTITDAGGLSVTSAVTVTVVPAVTKITVSPSSVTLAPGGQQQFTASASDQFGTALSPSAFTWAVISGPGKISSSGLFTASSTSGKSATVQASAGGATGRATVLTRAHRFMQALYQSELGRSGSIAELDGWVGVLDNPGGQPMVVGAIQHTGEARDHLVKGWYATYLGRPALGGEEQVFVNLLLAGLTEEQVLSYLLGSGEFFNRAQTLVSSGSPAQRVVAALYQVVLNRTPSSGELNAQVNNLAAMGQQRLALLFLGSSEGRNVAVASDYVNLLHRTADQGSLNAWIFSGLDLGTIRGDFEASSEFFANG